MISVAWGLVEYLFAADSADLFLFYMGVALTMICVNALFLGLPAYSIIRFGCNKYISTLTIILLSAIISLVIPIFVILRDLGLQSYPSDFYQAGQHYLIYHGHITQWGLIQDYKIIGYNVVIGTLFGLALSFFRFLVRKYDSHFNKKLIKNLSVILFIFFCGFVIYGALFLAAVSLF